MSEPNGRTIEQLNMHTFLNKFKNNDHVVIFLFAWTALLFGVDLFSGIRWFQTGDFGFRTVMAYHGLLIAAWLLLLMVFFRPVKTSLFLQKIIHYGIAFSVLLTGVGTWFVHYGNCSLWTGIFLTGLVFTVLISIVITVVSIRYFFQLPADKINSLALWTVVFAFGSMLLAAFPGLLAALIQTLGSFISPESPTSILAASRTGNYVDAHSHQMLASFLSAAFTLPLVYRQVPLKQKKISLLQTIGLILILLATLAQTTLYQYCAFSGWEPPVLFHHQLNGIPLDDAFLSILGLGMLLLLPTFWLTTGKKTHWLPISRLIAALLFAYLLAVVLLGIFIEFHESFFGQAEGNAPGVPHDLAFIRGHLLFGFFIIPLLLSVLLHARNFSVLHVHFFIVFGWLIVITGAAGVLFWVFSLNTILIKTAFYLTFLFLWMPVFLFRQENPENKT